MGTVLTRNEEQALFIRLAEGDETVREEIILSNTGLVKQLAGRYQGRGLPVEDLIQEGYLGLFRAINKFDYRKGFRFSTYATHWIRQAVTRALIEHGHRGFRLPVHQCEALTWMLRIEEHLMRELEREPTDYELAGAMGVKAERVGTLRRSVPVSLDMEVGEDLDTNLVELIPDEAAEPVEELGLKGSLVEAVQEALSHLRPRERDVIVRRFMDEEILDVIGADLGVTREWVRQIEQYGLKALRRYGDVHHLDEWL